MVSLRVWTYHDRTIEISLGREVGPTKLASYQMGTRGKGRRHFWQTG